MKTVCIHPVMVGGIIFLDCPSLHSLVHFGSFHVSSDGKKLLYVAEKKKPKATSFFAKSTPSKDDPPPAKVSSSSSHA